MEKITELIRADVQTVAILGHIRPDGDCVGSCLGLYHYLKDNCPNLQQIQIYLQPFSNAFFILEDADKISHDFTTEQSFDLCISCDASDLDRLGPARSIFDRAKRTACVDHHVTNPGFAQWNCVRGELSSAAETLFLLLDYDKISKACAACLYMGIVHDTGVFKYSATSEQTMMIAGKLMSKGIDYTKIIDDSYNSMTFNQCRICGKVMKEAKLAMDGRIIYGSVSLKDMEEYHVNTVDLDGVVDKLRVVEGIEIAIFLYQLKDEWKVSLRSNQTLDVSKIAVGFGGGGHEWAAGCQISGNVEDVIDKLLQAVQKAMNGH